ncbi:MAG TPA: SRPBCC domain-containing protein [Bryobacteraceae bacterium]|nr:SRPBCC domain-containing protein [Bryobacteraceae bacterium]
MRTIKPQPHGYAKDMRNIPALAIILMLASIPGMAEVADSGSNGFTLKTTVQIQAPPDAVYRRLIQVGDWWDSAHTFSGDAKNLSIDEKPGGCFCEKLPNGGGVRHMEVVFLAPGKRLVLSGGLGPLQAIGATGAVSVDLTPAEGGTKLQFTYAVTGYLAAGMNTLAAPVDSVWSALLARLKNLVEHGDPAPKAK